MTLPQFTHLMQIMGVRASSPIIAHIFKSIDTDGNNSIEFEEYVEFFSRLLKGSPRDKHHLTFSLIDSDHKGFFTYQNLKSLLILVFSRKAGNRANGALEAGCLLAEGELGKVEECLGIVYGLLGLGYGEECGWEYFVGRIEGSEMMRGVFEV